MRLSIRLEPMLAMCAALAFTASRDAQAAPDVPATTKVPPAHGGKPARKMPETDLKLVVEPRAMDVLKAATTSSAYNAGAAAAMARASGSCVMSMSYAALPGGVTAVSKNGMTYYASGNVRLQPAYGASGVCYKVVPKP